MISTTIYLIIGFCFTVYVRAFHTERNDDRVLDFFATSACAIAGILWIFVIPILLFYFGINFSSIKLVKAVENYKIKQIENKRFKEMTSGYRDAAQLETK